MFNVNMLWHVLQITIFLGLILFFAFHIFKEYLTVSKTAFCLISIVHVGLVSLLVCLCFTQVSPYRNFAGVGIVVIALGSLLLYRVLTHRKMIFFFFLIFMLLSVQVNALLLGRATMELQILPRMIAYEYGDFMLLSSIYCILIFTIVYTAVGKYYKKVVDDNIIAGHTKLLFCIPAMFYLVQCVFAKEMMDSHATVPGHLFLPLLLLNIFAIISYYAALKAAIEGYDAATEREKLVVAEGQLVLWETQYKNLRNRIDSNTRIRHDWRQHIIAIMDYVDRGNLEGLGEYLVDYRERYLTEDVSEICDIPPLNALFQYYSREAKEKGITFVVDTVKLGECGISYSELTVLFGNILENALEGCGRVEEGERRIYLSIQRQKYRIVLLCENNFDGVLQWEGECLCSEKENGGNGLTSIRGIVEKYNGQIKIDSHDKVFQFYAYLDVSRVASALEHK